MAGWLLESERPLLAADAITSISYSVIDCEECFRNMHGYDGRRRRRLGDGDNDDGKRQRLIDPAQEEEEEQGRVVVVVEEQDEGGGVAATPPSRHHRAVAVFDDVATTTTTTTTVYEEAKDALLTSILCYGVADLRTLARRRRQQQKRQQKKDDDDEEEEGGGGSSSSSSSCPNDNDSGDISWYADELLSLPISAKEVVRLVSKFRMDLVEEMGRESTLDLYLNAFDAIQSNSSSSSSSSSSRGEEEEELELELNEATFQVSLVSFDVVVADDERSDKELVYCICVDTSRRRITVAFRGCSSRTDWLVCAQTLLRAVDNPLYCEEEESDNSGSNSRRQRQPPKLSLHSGYYKYLFSVASDGGTTPRNKKKGEQPRKDAKKKGDDDETDKSNNNQTKRDSKFDTIMGQLQSLLRRYPGYQVYVTGHSLGAALATVFAFHAAAAFRKMEGNNNDAATTTTTNPLSPTITCINFASPMVGNFEFELAFRELEAQGRIRCLRVTNYFDIFTQLPDRGNWLYLLACTPWIGIHLLTYFGVSFLFFLCFQTHVYRHVGMDLHMYRRRDISVTSWWRRLCCCCFCCCRPFLRRNPWNGDTDDSRDDDFDDEDEDCYEGKNSSNARYWYKIKHSRGTSEVFVRRVVQDYKKHWKQIVQRIFSVPFVLDFDTNHSAREHLRRVKGLKKELKSLTLKELYEKRFPPGRPPARSSPLMSSCIV